jgi:hypothetical protein
MKNFYFGIFSVILLIGISNISVAQVDTLTVDPGLGTLNAAIVANGGNVVYKLQAGMWYGLDGIIESSITMNHLQIVGEKTSGLPAIVQVGNTPEGAVFNSLITTYCNLTLKNLFLSDQDFAGNVGTYVISLNAPVKLVVDNCVIDPAGINYTFYGENLSNGTSLFLTNSQIIRNGQMAGPNDGGWLAGTCWDTLWVENNTFVSSGQDFIGGAFTREPDNSFIWINHNTFLWHDVWIKKSYDDKDFFFTNNLMHDISIFAQLYAWGQFFPDYRLGNTMLSLTSIDTAAYLDAEGKLVNETLPSQRKVFWQRNLQYTSPPLKNLVAWAKKDKNTDLYFIPMLWDDDTPADYASIPVVSPADSSRENRILHDRVNWPFMKYNHNLYDVDPEYNDPMIYNINDSVGEHIVGWFDAAIFASGGDINALPSYNWDIDKWNNTPLQQYPTIWPRFDGSYKNPELLTASIEGLPLGDLNWFPKAKARWESEKDLIEAHILALNEEQYVLQTGVDFSVINPNSFSAFPNPSADIVTVKCDKGLKVVKLYDVTGKLLLEIAMQNLLTKDIDITKFENGLYIIKAESTGGEVFSGKFVKK